MIMIINGSYKHFTTSRNMTNVTIATNINLLSSLILAAAVEWSDRVVVVIIYCYININDNDN